MMKLGKAVLVLLFTGLVFQSLASPESPCVPKSFSQDRDKLRREFSLVDSKQDLFTAGSDYVIQPTYEARGRIIEIRVVPKYFFNQTHPQWTEPISPVVMPLAAYQVLLQQIADIKPLGNLIKQGQAGIMLNLRTTFRDQYEKGIVTGLELTATGIGPPKGYFWD
jgi:hypothetical protein